MPKFITVTDTILYTNATSIATPCGVVAPELCGVPNADPTMFLTVTWPGVEPTLDYFGCTWTNGETKEMYSTSYTLASGGGGASPATTFDHEYWTVAGAGTGGVQFIKLRHKRKYFAPFTYTFSPSSVLMIPPVHRATQRVDWALVGWFSSGDLYKNNGSPTSTGTGYAIGTIPPIISLNGGARTGALTINQARLGPAMLTGQATTSSGTTMSWAKGNNW